MTQPPPPPPAEAPYIDITVDPQRGPCFSSNLQQAQIALLLQQILFGVITGTMMPMNLQVPQVQVYGGPLPPLDNDLVR